MTSPAYCPACANRDCDEFVCSAPETCPCNCTGKRLATRVAELERRLTAQEERFQRFLETNELWDGS